MSEETTVVRVPPAMVAPLEKLITDYAAAVSQPKDEVRRLVELGVLTRGVRAMQVEVEEHRKLNERMGWT